MNEYTTVVVAIFSIVAVKLFCFYLGYRIVLMGYNLLREGIKGEFNFSAEYSGIKGGLISSSPGLLFLVLGVFLVGYSMSLSNEDINLKTTDNHSEYKPRKETQKQVSKNKNLPFQHPVKQDTFR